MNGAQALVRTLAGSGVEVCFSNPGTSEMHFVASLDAVPELRGVLCLFEGVATGAADGYGRMAGSPAATLLHLGPGLANGLANLHNARRARTPLLNVVGDHALSHKRYDAPLESDIDSLARTVSGWVRRTARSADVAADAAEGVAAALGPPGEVATLILPADVSWSDGAEPAPPVPSRPPSVVPEPVIKNAAGALRGGRGDTAHAAGGGRGDTAHVAGGAAIAAATGAQLLCETFPARLERGAGLPGLERLAYLAESHRRAGRDQPADPAGARTPVSFFAYPGPPSSRCRTAARSAPAAPGGTCAGAGLPGRAGRPRRPGAVPASRSGPGCPAGS